MKNKIISIDCYDAMIAFAWDTGETNYLDLHLLRERCPCAFCSGEKDVFGKTYKGPKQSLKDSAFSIVSFSFIGLYGIKIVWGDGHADGIFTFDFIKKLISFNEKK